VELKKAVEVGQSENSFLRTQLKSAKSDLEQTSKLLIEEEAAHVRTTRDLAALHALNAGTFDFYGSSGGVIEV